jgi:acetylornithine/succinyldiaminopimelate/putrescine aminotransferase
LEVVGTNYFRAPFRRQLKEFATLLPYPKIRFSSETEDFPECPPELLENLEHQIEQAAQTREIGCVLVEPIQGRGGEIIPPIGFLQMLRSVCNRLGLVLILDEIYTGLNRTGALFACEHFGVIPDIICLGKGLTSGFPLSACVGKAEIMDAWPESTGEALHTSTFLGNPLGCAMALASLEQHANPETATEVRRTGTKVKRAFQQIQSQHVVEVRGIGLLIGVELTLDGLQTNQLVKRALRDGMIWLQSGPAGNVLVFAPPFAMAEEEIAFTATRLQEYLTSLFGSIS